MYYKEVEVYPCRQLNIYFSRSYAAKNNSLVFLLFLIFEILILVMSKLLGHRTNRVIENLWLLLLRVSAGAFMLIHGIPKLQKLLNGDFAFAYPIGIGETSSLLLAVFAEVICSVLLILGAATRLATIPLISTMAVAAFVVHGADPFQKKEMALLYLVVYVTILVFGGGNYSAGKFLSKK